MAKKPETREELLAKLEAIDNSTEIAQLKAEVTRLTTDNALLINQRKASEMKLARMMDDFETLRKVLAPIERRNSRLTIGVATGTTTVAHKAPVVRDLSAGAPMVTHAELEKFFPELGCLPGEDKATLDSPLTVQTISDRCD
ncbi:hypothetical protein FY036_06880 [Mesorhizobium microcysteis]|uniref:Uncharacterized protein n=1 Tax=Neoaquamicrobium microcysteis TaxID=2682781 RepID=A0A5D4GYU9_9HYPH|nr:hypothetical protein [Mesorhizobium microcysteis]TYR33766.1 hypothetical protein FY036_06880 [Mesorhizobium microcysteis]